MDRRICAVKRVFLLLLLVSVAFLGCGDDENKGPTITGMTPNTVSIGQLGAEASITGTNLTGVTAVTLGDGITVTGIQSRSATQVAVTFDVSAGAATGPRTVTVTAGGRTASSTTVFNVSSNVVPTPGFTINPSTGAVTTVITFDGSGSVDTAAVHGISTYDWTFGDGASAQGVRVTHKYAAVGQYTVTLKVTDDNGGHASMSKTLSITSNAPPVAKMKVTPGTKGDTNTIFHFDGTRSKDDKKIVDYIWDFGDGTRKHSAEADHQYEKKGTYTAMLTVEDKQGAKGSASETLTVEQATEKICQGSGVHHPLVVRGKVVAVEPGQWAIVNFGANGSCNKVWHKCDDFRKYRPEGFYGIVDKMAERGGGIMAVHNKCPLHWPPSVGEEVFVIWKTCAQNYCP
jgi:PKD repeat protein